MRMASRDEIRPHVDELVGQLGLGIGVLGGILRAGVLGKDDGVHPLLLAQDANLFGQLLPQGIEMHALHAEKGDLDAVLFIDVGRQLVKDVHARAGERLHGAGFALIAVVQRVIVVQVGGLDAGQRQDARKVRRAAEAVGFVDGVAGVILEHAFEVDNGQVIFGKEVAHLFKEVGITLFPGIVVEGPFAVDQPILAAQRAVSHKGDGDGCFGQRRARHGKQDQAQRRCKRFTHAQPPFPGRAAAASAGPRPWRPARRP